MKKKIKRIKKFTQYFCYAYTDHTDIESSEYSKPLLGFSVI